MSRSSPYIIDRSHAEHVRHVPPDRLIEHFAELGKRLAVTTGRFEVRNGCHVRDLDWNHMDQHHRPWIHDTYHEAVRLATTPDAAVSVTKMRIAGIPLLIQVSDVRLEAGLFYQTFSLLGLFLVHIVIRAVPVEPAAGEACASLATVEWFLVSHRFLRPLHKVLNGKLERLNRVQNEEDREIRDRRAELRNKGYGFSSDEPDFISSNALTLNTRPPALPPGEHRVALPPAGAGGPVKVSAGAVELLLRRDAGGVTVWPAACPHEGADLSRSKECVGREITCHWHGLRFSGLMLDAEKPEGLVGLLGVRLDGDAIVVRQAVEPGAFRPVSVEQNVTLPVFAPPVARPLAETRAQDVVG